MDKNGPGADGRGLCRGAVRAVLRQLRATETHAPLQAGGLSVWAGVAVVFLGVVVLTAAVVQHFTLIRKLRSGTWQPGRVSWNAVVLAALLGLVGLGMAIYLIVVR